MCALRLSKWSIPILFLSIASVSMEAEATSPHRLTCRSTLQPDGPMTFVKN